MPAFPVNEAGAIGIVADRMPHELPFNAWSAGQNVRFRDGYVEKFVGESQVFDPPTVAPYFVMPVPTAATYFWLYLGLLKAYVTDGATHTNLTRTVGGDYGATAARNWTGCVLGGIPVVNNGIDDPQMWNPPSTGTPFALLSNWPANTKVGALRAYKNFLVALDVTKTTTRYGQMVKWSHGAAAGAVPSTWDPADATKDAGEYMLADTPGFCVDSVPLRRANIVYKEDSVYVMNYIGGTQIFSFDRVFKEFGILSRRCAVEFFSGRHAVFGQGDVVQHDGASMTSILDEKMRKFLFNRIDSANISMCFTVCNYARNEVWFCYPQTGSSFPNQAVVWNFKRNTLGVRDLNNIAHIDSGLVNPGASPSTWGGDTAPWSSDSTTWDERAYNPAVARLLQARPDATKLLLADDTNLFNGAAMTSYIERTGLGIPFKTQAPPDFTTMKFFDSVWPRFDGPNGTQIDVYCGVQDKIDGPITYNPPQPFVIGTDEKIDALVSGRLLALRFQTASSADWRLHGYEVEVRPMGRF